MGCISVGLAAFHILGHLRIKGAGFDAEKIIEASFYTHVSGNADATTCCCPVDLFCCYCYTGCLVFNLFNNWPSDLPFNHSATILTDLSVSIRQQLSNISEDLVICFSSLHKDLLTAKTCFLPFLKDTLALKEEWIKMWVFYIKLFALSFSMSAGNVGWSL